MWHLSGSRGNYLIIGILVLLCLFIRSTWTENYKIQHQMDFGYHSNIVRKLEEHKKYNRSPAPLYYSFVAIVHGVTKPEGGKHRDGLSEAVHIVNSVFFILFLAGFACLINGRFSKKSSYYLCIALVAFSPALNRIFSIARPEIIMIVMFVWCLVLYFRIKDGGPLYLKILFCLLLGLASTQKITGLFFYPMIVGIHFCTGDGYRNKKATRSVAVLLLCALAVSALSVEASKRIGGSYLWQHKSANQKVYQNTPTLDIFVRYKPVEMMKNPFRNNHKDSMSSILLIGLFGDYFEYGINSKRTNLDKSERLPRARFGVSLSHIYIVLLLVAFISHVYNREKDPLSKYSAVVVVLSVSTLIAAAYSNNYAPFKFDIMKWDYIPWAIPFLFLPVISYRDKVTEGTPKWLLLNSLLMILIIGSVMQSILIIA